MPFPFPGIPGNTVLQFPSRKSGMEFFTLIPVPENGNGIFITVPVPKNWKWNYHSHSRHLGMEFPVPVPKVQKSFPLTPDSSPIVRNFTDLPFPVQGEVIFQKYPEYNGRTNCEQEVYLKVSLFTKKYRLFLRSKYLEMKYVPEIFLSI